MAASAARARACSTPMPRCPATASSCACAGRCGITTPASEATCNCAPRASRRSPRLAGGTEFLAAIKKPGLRAPVAVEGPLARPFSCLLVDPDDGRRGQAGPTAIGHGTHVLGPCGQTGGVDGDGACLAG